MAQIPPAKRPHYPPAERLAILTLRAARMWTIARTAKAFLVAELTISNWMRRLEESGEDALVQTSIPVTKYPDFIAALVQRLKALVPIMGRRKIADTLGRAGLHLGPSTVRRMLRKDPPDPSGDGAAQTSNGSEQTDANKNTDKKKSGRVVTAKYPDHLWHVDLTVVPTLGGFWIPWLCQALPASWPFAWRILVVLDHFSRTVVGFEVFPTEPTGLEVARALERIVKEGRGPPKHIVSDKGVQFRSEYFLWCLKHGVRPRFGAVGQHGSIAVIERFIRTLKEEGLRRVLVPLGIARMRKEIAAFVTWYGEHRPHATLGGRTPNEVLSGKRPQRLWPRFEPRARFPRRYAVRAKHGQRLELHVDRLEGRHHLPLVRLEQKRAA
jgi:putative transposase